MLFLEHSRPWELTPAPTAIAVVPCAFALVPFAEYLTNHFCTFTSQSAHRVSSVHDLCIEGIGCLK